MRPMARLFEIVQILGHAPGVVTAAALAERLEVVPRTIYRDIAALQAMRIPVEGARGLGYILRPGFTLPPMMFTVEETEALIVALGLLRRQGDTGLREAAVAIAEKIAASVPPVLARRLAAPALHVWGFAPAQALDDLRRAIRDEEKLDLTYRDQSGHETSRRVWPLAVIYYPEAANLVAWCEARPAIRHFRPDRIVSAVSSGQHFRGEGERLHRQWQAGWQAPAGIDSAQSAHHVAR